MTGSGEASEREVNGGCRIVRRSAVGRVDLVALHRDQRAAGCQVQNDGRRARRR
jgi:hypothetical protein